MPQKHPRRAGASLSGNPYGVRKVSLKQAYEGEERAVTETVTTSTRVAASGFGSRESAANIPLICAAVLTALLVATLIVVGFPYYRLSPEDRPYSPLHSMLRSSGTVGLKLGFLGVALFGVLFLYPLRKHWRWLAGIGKTSRWLNSHALVGMAAPVIITFHTAFKWRGLAGVAWGIMVTVAVSGFIGRYLYAKIPRELNSVQRSDEDLEAETNELLVEAIGQPWVNPQDFSVLLNLPTSEEIRRMNLLVALWTMLSLDLARPLQVYRLRRRATHSERARGSNREIDGIIANVRRLSTLRTKTAFLHRTERVFHLWHVIHRPFSLSFVVLVVIHIGVVLAVGVR